MCLFTSPVLLRAFLHINRLREFFKDAQIEIQRITNKPRFNSINSILYLQLTSNLKNSFDENMFEIELLYWNRLRLLINQALR